MLEASCCIFNYWRHEVTVYQLIMDSLIHPRNGTKALLMGRALRKLVFVGDHNCGITLPLQILENGGFFVCLSTELSYSKQICQHGMEFLPPKSHVPTCVQRLGHGPAHIQRFPLLRSSFAQILSIFLL